MEKSIDDILVSVCVLTYNSADTVIETLDSIASQTHRRLELIISDDCSRDNTVDACRTWLAQHTSRFEYTELLTVEHNTGIPANFNRAEAACKGEWVKEIAGDDIMMPECVETFLAYTAEHPESKFIFSKVEMFADQGCEMRENLFDYAIFELPVEEQYKRLLDANCLPAPSFFFNRAAAQVIGLKNDERIRCFEDWPKWVYLTKRGVRFGFIPQALVRYRVRSTSITHAASQAYDESYERFFYYYLYEPLCHYHPSERHRLRTAYYSAIKKYRFSIWAMCRYRVYMLLRLIFRNL